jgi:hypothetical protein
VRLELPRGLAALIALCLALAARPRAAAEEAPTRYVPPSKTFSCDVPSGWSAFEDDEGEASAVHVLGPDGSGGNYRVGIDIRYMEKGSASFLPYKKFVEGLRRSDSSTDRSSTPIRAMRVGAGLARTFEITETRRLPLDRLPAVDESLHHYVAIFPSGDNYFIVTLSSTRDVYLDYRDFFVEFLRNFRPFGLR